MCTEICSLEYNSKKYVGTQVYTQKGKDIKDDS